MKPLSLIAVFLIVLHLASCAGTTQMYQGPEQSPENVAMIKGHDHPISPVAVYAVDGVETGFNKISAVVLPGSHYLTIYLSQMKNPLITYHARGTVILNAQAGHVYQVRGKIIDEDNVWIWIEDENTGQIVAGEKPEMDL
jgi:hypothetical protein